MSSPPRVTDRYPGYPAPVWVLGASMGGPQALAEFLSRLKPDLPGCLILAQHIGEHDLPILGAQLGHGSPLRILPADEAGFITPGMLLLAPVDRRITIGEDGRLGFQPYSPETRYRPCIDDIMAEVASRYPRRCGAIIFSGMGSDGARGARTIFDARGMVWAQDPASCASPSMPMQVMASGIVSYCAPPQQLGQRLCDHLAARYRAHFKNADPAQPDAEAEQTRTTPCQPTSP